MQQSKREKKEDQERVKELISLLQVQEERLSKLEKMKAEKESERRAKQKLIGHRERAHPKDSSSGSGSSRGTRKTTIAVTEKTLEQSQNGGWHVVDQVTREYDSHHPETIAQLATSPPIQQGVPVSRIPVPGPQVIKPKVIPKPVPVLHAKLETVTKSTRSKPRSGDDSLRESSALSGTSSDDEAIAARKKEKRKAGASRNLWELAANEYAATAGKPPLLSPERKASSLLKRR
ncbi:hypothetical protein HDU93_004472 [Gonapodya sp. JEL0774]|nr:hypothetical protein HDU93_004472 [Gonapodya sp. JEL0774]